MTTDYDSPRKLLAAYKEHGTGALATAEEWAARYAKDVAALLDKFDGIEGDQPTYSHRIVNDFQTLDVAADDDEDADFWAYVPSAVVRDWVADIAFHVVNESEFDYVAPDGTKTTVRLEWQRGFAMDPNMGRHH